MAWEKLQKNLKATFLPHNYARTVYTKLQNLRQGSRTVDDYAEEFSLLLTWTDIYDSPEQLVSRFIWGLRPQLQSALAQFDPTTLAEAHRRAATCEQLQKTSTWGNQSSRVRSTEQTNQQPAAKEGEATTQQGRTTNQPEENLRRSTCIPSLKCYTCGEPGHRHTTCPQQTRRGLVIEEASNDDPVYDSYGDDDEADNNIVQTSGDTGHLLVAHRSCLMPRRPDESWLRTNFFRSNIN